MDDKPSYAILAEDVPPRTTPSNYPEPFASRMAGRVKRQLGERFRLRNFGVNLTTLAPGSVSALYHSHTAQDEFIFILQGRPTLVIDSGEETLAPGMCAGFARGTTAHQLRNDGDEPVVYLEIGDRAAGDTASYPRDDLVAALGEDGRWKFFHKDGSPY